VSYVYRKCKGCAVSSWVDERKSDRNEIACSCGDADWIRPVELTRKWAGLIIPDKGWTSENGGRGHYCSQLEDKPSTKKSPHAFVQSAREMKEKLAERGFKVTRDGY
jgi:hypothetical protein